MRDVTDLLGRGVGRREAGEAGERREGGAGRGSRGWRRVPGARAAATAAARTAARRQAHAVRAAPPRRHRHVLQHREISFLSLWLDAAAAVVAGTPVCSNGGGFG